MTHDDVKNDMRNYWNNNSHDYPYLNEVLFEESFIGGGTASYNQRGSSRIDVLITNTSNNEVYIADLKTGSQNNTYSPTQQGKNATNYGGIGNPNGYTYTHEEIRP